MVVGSIVANMRFSNYRQHACLSIKFKNNEIVKYVYCIEAIRETQTALVQPE